MVKKGEYIDYLINIPDDILFGTEMTACREMALAIRKLEKENIELEARLTVLEERAG